MKVKTGDLTGAALDWVVAKCEGKNSIAACYYGDDDMPLWLDEAPNPTWEPSTNWAQGGPIIERERIDLDICGNDWRAVSEMTLQSDTPRYYGPTPLIAAMRCYVASKLGDEIDVSDDLVWDELIYEKGDEE